MDTDQHNFSILRRSKSTVALSDEYQFYLIKPSHRVYFTGSAAAAVF